MMNTLENFAHNLNKNMDNRDRRPTELLESAVNTLVRKPAKTGTEETHEHDKYCDFTEVKNLISKTRLSHSYDDNQ